MCERNKLFLLDLARNVILKKNKEIDFDKSFLDEDLLEKRGCFVTLTIDDKLRGCVGYILPYLPLYKAVIENAYNAAYGDYRFEPLSENEYTAINIEISILSIPENIQYVNFDDLLNQINPATDGLILNHQGSSATFLPQVWTQLPDKEDFLSQLSLKAGLKKDAWKSNDMQVQKYNVQIIKDIK
ncbi:MAG: hypothetical protein A2015_16405 [Spirochaetes bacterium GWF1_31_7]|nr:MAG: hypothetical protein A2Y30_13770 [Spirochaetes bacterium GWE1_32_154]OHD50027.1 MAG: hypothetical protein A2Y29_11815 [Spirochaetes bacterium GWE2_31_10]OHD52341.1 MAG: hypothetical protein A2015_16405 [Spirochaetes bacterium GWF1_31_7]HBI38492.1 AmmeMemoRadiSam system protein A [Spirochaetia bacterium]